MKAPNETALVKAGIELLRLRGIMCWRNNTGALWDARHRPVRFGLVGSSDILGIVSPHGRFLAAEAKMPGKKVTVAQRAFLDEVSANGGLAIVFYDLNELEQALRDVGLWE